MKFEVIRQFNDLFRQRLHRLGRNSGVRILGPVVALEASPVHVGVGVSFLILYDVGRYLFAVVEAIAVGVDKLGNLVRTEYSGGDQPVGIELAGGLQLTDLFVHQWLSGRRLIGLVMPVSAVTNQVDDDVSLECLAKIAGDLHDMVHGFRLVRVDVEDRRMDHLGDRGAVQGGSGVPWNGGEADLVVDHDVHRPAGGEAAGLGQLEGLGHDALAGEGGVAMNQHGHHSIYAQVTPPVLPRSGGPYDHGVYDLEVRGIEGKGDVHGLAIFEFDVRRVSEMILDVTRCTGLAG